MSSPAPLVRPTVVARMAEIVGAEYCTVDLEQRRFYSTDLSFIPGKVADLVVRPAKIGRAHV